MIDNSLAGTQGIYAAAVKNLKTGETYYLNEHQIFPAGSLYKLWVMAAAFKQIETGELQEDLVLSEDVGILNAKFGIASGSAEIKGGTITLTVADALNQMIVISHNLSALLLTEKIKLSAVAAFLKAAGLDNSKVGILGEDPTITASDLALFLEKLYKGELGNEENTKKMLNLLISQQLNDKIPKLLPAGTAVAHKTGEIEWFSHDGGIVFAPFGDYIIVVLSESDFPSGANDRIAQVSKAVYDYFKGSPAVKQAEKDIEIIAENLSIPWELAFLPDGEILVTQRPGSLLLIKNHQKIPVEGVEHIGEGGLLGLALHPNFKENKLIYLYLTSRAAAGLTNRVECYKFENNRLSERKVILEGIAGAANHDGGRMAFGPASGATTAGKPDYYLYITTGDAQSPESSQDRNSLNGKILRIKDDGSIPIDNPFGNEIFSLGHRNPQGLTWDDQGRLWATEHGSQAEDELNLIQKGKNYGWPVIRGDEKKEGLVSPVIHSGPSDTWAPTGAIFYQGNIFFTGLRGEAIYKYNLADKSFKEYFKGEFGRIRTIVIGPDNNFYILTNNTDGRGAPKQNDDKLIRINPKILKSS